MKRHTFVHFLLTAGILGLTHTPLNAAAFGSGEELQYQAYFQIGFVSVNHLLIETDIQESVHNGQAVYDITASGETQKTLGNLYPLKDSFRVQMRQSDLKPVWFYEHDKENKYEAVKQQTFLYQGDTTSIAYQSVKNGKQGESYHNYIGNAPVDPLTIIYGLRNYAFEKMKVGDKIHFTYFDPDGDTDICLTYSGEETIKLKGGKRYKCIKLSFNVAEGTVFSKKEPVHIWLSDDDNRLIVHAEAKLKIGYAKVDLVDAKGTKHPITSLVTDNKKK
ncbi:MAG: DUF3108 domain-containing protein [Paludibacteraceae bacterium]|nr:DUF3108 domain-containing protein [Paludibacteraceae bacterium]